MALQFGLSVLATRGYLEASVPRRWRIGVATSSKASNILSSNPSRTRGGTLVVPIEVTWWDTRWWSIHWHASASLPKR